MSSGTEKLGFWSAGPKTQKRLVEIHDREAKRDVFGLEVHRVVVAQSLIQKFIDLPGRYVNRPAEVQLSKHALQLCLPVTEQ